MLSTSVLPRLALKRLQSLSVRACATKTQTPPASSPPCYRGHTTINSLILSAGRTWLWVAAATAAADYCLVDRNNGDSLRINSATVGLCWPVVLGIGILMLRNPHVTLIEE